MGPRTAPVLRGLGQNFGDIGNPRPFPGFHQRQAIQPAIKSSQKPLIPLHFRNPELHNKVLA
jgi:hypothetical protein